ncbi:MAG: rhodanese-like domain-containing protein [Flavipsychrobacter sp.]|nr:rhodanese-like domain-containing protein [Flavipsychrobacter sp.]
MVSRSLFWLVLLVIAVGAMAFFVPGGSDPWKESQLMAPAALAKVLNDPAAHKPVIFSVGPGADIKRSVEIGPAQDAANLQKLRQELSKLNKDEEVVIVCGCCPFANCPNIRPAFNLLNEMKFTRHKLLDLPHNLKVDWISKGYPMN